MTAKLELTVDATVAKRIIANLPQVAEDMLRMMAEDMTDEIRGSMGTGGNYKLWPSKSGAGGMHWSAPPFSPPNPDTRKLLSSIKFTKRGKLVIDIHDGVEYGVYQEMGTTSGGWNGGGHAPRPFMRPVFKKYGDPYVMFRYAVRARLMQK